MCFLVSANENGLNALEWLDVDSASFQYIFNCFFRAESRHLILMRFYTSRVCK